MVGVVGVDVPLPHEMANSANDSPAALASRLFFMLPEDMAFLYYANRVVLGEITNESVCTRTHYPTFGAAFGSVAWRFYDRAR